MTGSEVKSLRKNKGITQEQLAIATGIPLGTLGRIESNNEQVKKVDVLNAINKFFDIGGSSTKAIKMNNDEVPYLEGVTASAGLELLTNNGDATSYIKIPGAGVEVYINVFGDSMYPKYCSGEIIGIKRVEKDMVFFGNAYVIEMKDGEAYIKYLYPGKDENHWEFRSENPKHPSQQFHLNKISKVYKIKTTITKNSL